MKRIAWQTSLPAKKAGRLSFVTSVKPTVVGGPMVDCPISASTIASGSKPARARQVAAQRNRVVFPVSDAPKNIVTPGRFAKASKTASQAVCFFWLGSLTAPKGFLFPTQCGPEFIETRQLDSVFRTLTATSGS